MSDGDSATRSRSSAPPRLSRSSISEELDHARATAEALRVEKEQLARVLATAPGAFLAFRFDAQGKGTCPYGSVAVRDVYGLDPDALAEDAGPVLERIHPADVDRVQETIFASAETLEPCLSEYRYLHPDKGEVWIRVHSIPSREADGGTLWLGFIEDVSDRRRAEELTRETQKMEALATLANGIAHDFNNLLTVMAGNCAIASRALVGHPVAPLLGEVEQALGRAADLVEQIQDFGSPTPRAWVPVSLRCVVEEAVRLHRATLPGRCQLEVKTDPATPTVKGDAGQLHQVVSNLVRNAVQALRGGEGTVAVRTDAVDLDAEEAAALGGIAWGRHALLTVRDDGVGMDESVLRHVFEPYFTTKGLSVGMGLGLSMVHRVVARHGGAIRVQSAPGEGATFRVYLPEQGPGD